MNVNIWGVSLGRRLEEVGEDAEKALYPWTTDKSQTILMGIGVLGSLTVLEVLKVVQALIYCNISPEMCSAGVHAIFTPDFWLWAVVMPATVILGYLAYGRDKT